MASLKSSSLLEGIDSAAVSTTSKKGSKGIGLIGSMDARSMAMLIGSIVLILVAGVLLFRSLGLGTVDPGAASRSRIAIDAETGQVFENFKLRDNDTVPWAHPSTGKRTMYPAEQCYWTADGQAKLTPTYVLLNEYKGDSSPTMCPDCGRPVVGHNPMPPPELLVQASERAKSEDK